MNNFVGREREINLISQLWQNERSDMFILTGRRRVGKTRLLTHWLGMNSQAGFYWMAEKTSSVGQLRSFSRALFKFMYDDEAPSDFKYSDWEQALNVLAAQANKNGKASLFIDEVTYIVDADSTFPAMLQKLWDHKLKDSNLLIGLSGSHQGLIEKHFVEIDAPMYGRISQHMHLDPLPFNATLKFFPNYSSNERLFLYSILGGIPEYWERIDKRLSVAENLKQKILPSYGWMSDEARILIQDYVKDENIFVAVLRALAADLSRNKDIAEHAGIENNKVSFYLKKLQDTKFVVREVPTTKASNPPRNAGRYILVDPFLRFYHRYISPNASYLAMGKTDEIMAIIQDELGESFLLPAWAKICREWVLTESLREKWGQIVHIGEEWSKGSLLNVVGVGEKTLVIGHAFLQKSIESKDTFQQFLKASEKISLENKTVYILLFSNSGWSTTAEANAKSVIDRLKQSRKSSLNWDIRDVQLLSLKDVDDGLAN